MAFAVIIGGIGTIEGPILGTIVYMVLQQTLQSYNAWYLIVLGIVAIAIAMFARRGLWGTLDERFNIRLFPVGYYLWTPGESRRRQRPAAHAASSRLLFIGPCGMGFASRAGLGATVAPCGWEVALAARAIAYAGLPPCVTADIALRPVRPLAQRRVQVPPPVTTSRPSSA